MRKRLLGNCEVLPLVLMSERMTLHVMTWQGGSDSPDYVGVQASVGEDSLYEGEAQVVEETDEIEGLTMTPIHCASPLTSRNFASSISMSLACLSHCIPLLSLETLHHQ